MSGQAPQVPPVPVGIWLKTLVKRVSNVHRPGPLPDVFVFTTARSGSTLLSEILTSQPGMKFVNEPLDVRDAMVMRESGFKGFADLLPHPRRKALLQDYFTRLKHNKVPYANPNPFSRDRVLFSDRICFKILHGCKDLANWFRDEFSGRVLTMYRHPIAVTLSRRYYPSLPFYLQNEEYMARFSPEQQVLIAHIINKGNDLEQGVLDWCLQNVPLIFCQDKQGWVELCYEDIVLRPSETAAELARQLDLPDPARMVASASRPSRTVCYSGKDTKDFFEGKAGSSDRRYLVEKWRKRVSAEEQERAFDIVEAFGIDLYRRGETEPTQQLP